MGATREDVVVHGSGLTLFVGGLPIRDALERIGTTVVPIGTGASEKAVQAMDTLGVTALHSTPSYARYLADYVREKVGRDPREFGLSKVFVGGEPGGGEPAFREHLESEWGARVTEGLGNADMAPVLFGEAPDTGGMRFTGGRHVLVELIDPDSGEPIAAEPGVTGELVYTSVDRECCPLVRFRTRDLVRVTAPGARRRAVDPLHRPHRRHAHRARGQRLPVRRARRRAGAAPAYLRRRADPVAGQGPAGGATAAGGGRMG